MQRPASVSPLIALALAALLSPGCGKSPTAPAADSQPAPVPIQTPVAAFVQSISVTKFPAKKADGSDWDLSLISSSRRPDLYVTLGIPGQIAKYVSNIVTNAETGHVYTFTQPQTVYDGSLPQRLPYGNSFRVYLMDDDVGGDDDRVGWITVNLPTAYHNDNAPNLDYTFADSGDRIHIRVRGAWAY